MVDDRSTGNSLVERAAFVRALEALDRALEQNIERAQRMKRRIEELEDACAGGRPIRAIVPNEETPPLVNRLRSWT